MDREQQRVAVRETCTSFVRSRFDAYMRSQGREGAEERTCMADIELGVWQEMLVLARRQRNWTRDACSLPSEILTHIFMDLRDIWEPKRVPVSNTGLASCTNEGEGDSMAGLKYTPGWITVLAVCSSWRQTALNSPPLWTRIPCLDVHPKYIPVMLARSQGLPLELEAIGDNQLLKPDISTPPLGTWLCRPVLVRTRRIDIGPIPDGHLSLWLGALHHPLSNLEDLSVDRKSAIDNAKTIRLPDKLSNQHLPKLRYLYLQGVGFSWNTCLFANTIVDLKLQFTGDSFDERLAASCAPTGQQFCEVISAMTALELLWLGMIFPPISHAANPYTITLPPGFKDLYLDASKQFVDPCLDLFKRIAFPKDATVILNLTPDTPNVDTEIAPLIHRIFTSTEKDPLELCLTGTVFFVSFENRPWEDTLKSKVPTSGDEWSTFDPSQHGGSRGLSVSYPENTDQKLFTHLSSLPNRTLRSIICATDASDDLHTPDAWTTNFAVCSDLQYLSIPYDAALHLFEALCEASVGTDGAEHALLFPALSTIALHSDQKTEESPETITERRGALDVVLVDMLHCRRRTTAPLDLLLVDDGYAAWDVWNRARDLVRVEFFCLQDGQ